MLTGFAPAKVNLTLHVGPVKANGRHDLDSLTVFTSHETADRLVVAPADTLQLAVIGPYADACGAIGENLVMKAAYALRKVMNVDAGAQITLVKHLPVAAGIGGGSSDAATALRLLNTLWDGPKVDTHLLALAEKLGGDVPVCLRPKAVMMRGEGERLVPVTLPGQVPAVLVNSGVACPTGPVFRRFDSIGGGADFSLSQPPAVSGIDDLVDWLDQGINDLEGPAMSLVPEIASVLGELRALSGVRLARMSGSGATCFALFNTPDDAARAAATLTGRHPEWWVKATLLGTPHIAT